MAIEIEQGNSRLKGALGWATLGLGAGLLAAPSRVARLIGAPDDECSRVALRAVGLRELAAYVLIERSGPTAAFPLWVRAGGDAIDLTLLGLAARRKGADRTKLGMAAANIAAIAAIDAYAAIRLGAAGSAPEPDNAGPEDDLSKDPAYEPPEPFRGIKGG
jgi:hypothetical protein